MGCVGSCLLLCEALLPSAPLVVPLAYSVFRLKLGTMAVYVSPRVGNSVRTQLRVVYSCGRGILFARETDHPTLF